MFWIDAVTVLCARYPKATELNLKGCPCVDEVLVHQAMVSLRLVGFSMYFILALYQLIFSRTAISLFFCSMKHFETIEWLT